MSRSQESDTYNTAKSQNATYNTNAQTAFGNAQKDVNSYQSQLAKFAGANPFVQGGEAERTENQQLADTANAGANSAAQGIQSAAVRTGSNPAGAVAASEEIAQQNQRTLGTQEAGATENRIANEAGYDQTTLAGSATAENMQDALAQQQASAAQGTLNTEQSAAQTPSFMDMLGGGLIQAGSSFAGGYGGAMCPAKGSLFLMSNGDGILVEKLKMGDLIQGIDGEPERIKEIQSVLAKILRITTDGGHILRNSYVHTLALPKGGFVVVTESLGKIVATREGKSRVISVEPDGEDIVYNVITDGSHTYCADGVWALGVDEMERMGGWAAFSSGAVAERGGSNGR